MSSNWVWVVCRLNSGMKYVNKHTSSWECGLSLFVRKFLAFVLRLTFMLALCLSFMFFKKMPISRASQSIVASGLQARIFCHRRLVFSHRLTLVSGDKSGMARRFGGTADS